VRVDALDTGVTPNTITLGRGCADTVPQPQAANSRIWFYDGFAGEDFTEYTDGETIDVELLTNTGSAQLDPSLSTPLALTFDGRQARPYPPANVQINGQWYPSDVTAPVSLTFNDRDRLGQADQLVDYSAASVGPEAGVTYTLRGYIEDTLDTTVSGPGSPLAWAPSAGGNCRIDLVSVRDGIESNVWSHSFTQAAPWTPASLFVGGTGGAWFDPADFSTLFQDTAGTTPVTAAGQSVARMLDKSGNGHHATQATPANCPTIQQDGSGNWYLSFNGSQYLDCGTGFNADQFSCGVAYQWTGSGSQRLLDARGTGSVGAVKGWYLKTTDPSGNDGFVVDDGTQYITSNHTTSTGTNHVFYGDFITPSALRYELEGGAGLTTVGGSTLGSTTSTQTSRIGAASNNATQTLTGRVYGIIVVKKAPSTTEIANMRAWCASKSGVTL
ncbi:MAG TPA: hypothetical protein VFK45_01020, partial [Gammaproteobacteria bacterium]|nr:hypothetical protein [Gammaproteobacteria bacterium]